MSPWLYELELDDNGWVDLEALLAALRCHKSAWRQVGEEDIRRLMTEADKQRFEMRSGRIRALCGHSTPQRLQKEAAEPPEQLFHGTSPESARITLREGLKPMSRQYVHLSADRETALQVGRRKSPRPQILIVTARRAHNEGIEFFRGNEQVWLAHHVPARYILEEAQYLAERLPHD